VTRRAGALAALGIQASAVAFVLLGGASGAEAAPVQARSGVVFLLVVDRVSFEELMAVPAFRQLARLGGSGLMATDQAYRDRVGDVYRALGSGAPPGAAQDQLLGRTLVAAGVSVCVLEGSASGQPGPTSPDRFLGAGTQQNCSGALRSRSVMLVANDPSTFELDDRSSRQAPVEVARRRAELLAHLGGAVRGLIDQVPPVGRWMALVVTPSPSKDMVRAGDEVTPIVVATGRPGTPLRASGPIPGMTSETTRQDGLVANVDVAPTVLDFFGLPIPAAMDGLPIRPGDGVAPFGLHRLHLEARRTRLGVQFSLLGFVVVVGLLGIGSLLLLRSRRELPALLASVTRLALLSAAAILLVLLAGGWLPRRTYLWEFGFMVVATTVLVAMSLTWSKRGPFEPFTLIGVVALAFVVLDALLGWHAMRVPLFGGTMFDGVRFYGLPNAFTAMLLAAAVYVARRLGPAEGFLLLLGAGLFAGFPALGADVGGAITLFTAAGIWWVLRTRPRVGVKEVAFVAGVAAVGLGLTLLLSRILPGSPTHATRFVERAGSGLGSAFDVLRHRLAIGAHQVASQPTRLIPLLGLPIALWTILARPRPIGEAMDLDAGWRHATVTIILAAMVAYFANDTGTAAAGPAFIYAFVGIAYPAMLIALGRPEAQPS
jgi:hypothetical protein